MLCKDERLPEVILGVVASALLLVNQMVARITTRFLARAVAVLPLCNAGADAPNSSIPRFGAGESSSEIRIGHPALDGLREFLPWLSDALNENESRQSNYASAHQPLQQMLAAVLRILRFQMTIDTARMGAQSPCA